MRKVTKVEVAFNKGYRVDRDGVLHGIKVEVLAALINSGGYQYFVIRVGAKQKGVNVHRLQAFQKFGQEIFQEGIQVRHLNGDQLDNSWGNIAIGTASENKMDTPKDGFGISIQEDMVTGGNMDRDRFERFIETIISEGDGEYADGTPMTEDARAFLTWYRQLNELWLTMKRLYSEREKEVEHHKKLAEDMLDWLESPGG